MGFIFNSSKINKNENKIVALAGNPNVGKSTLFNVITGLNQHTGNWAGKTVANAFGNFSYNNNNFTVVDLPGTYSLVPHSKEEEVARDFLCYEKYDVIVAVCDATCLERNLNLVLQILEITDNVILCVNLIDEAKRKGINVNINKLSKILGIPVVSTNALKNKGVDKLLSVISSYKLAKGFKVKYIAPIENAVKEIESILPKNIFNKRWVSLRLLEDDQSVKEKFYKNSVIDGVERGKNILSKENLTQDKVSTCIASGIIITAEGIFNDVVTYEKEEYNKTDIMADKILTHKVFGFLVMIMLLLIIFWLTIVGANYPSDLLSKMFMHLENYLLEFLIAIGSPKIINEMLVFGVFRVVSWVVSVMLPPMAIFFPLFTFLEDLGYLPRIAFNLDKVFKKCNACGKQALTMW